MGRLLSMKVVGLKSLKDTQLNFVEHGCTALVGPNDSGKSSLLRALWLFFTEHPAVRPDERSRGLGAAPYAECTFDFGGELEKALNFPRGQYKLSREFTRGAAYRIQGITKTDVQGKVGWQPATNFLPHYQPLQAELFAYQYPRKDVGAPTRRVISDRFHLAAPLPPIQQREADDTSTRELGKLVRDSWKSSPRHGFTCIHSGDHVTHSIEDDRRQYFPLCDMGGGLQRFLSLIFQIDEIRRKEKGDLLIALDEPENSLHPQAQRDLLRFLNRLPDTQVVYATHSPAMIDLTRPETTKTVLFDYQKESTIVLDRKHLYDNYETTRLALGVLPTDSLCYGFVNIIVEGAIDLLVYTSWAQKLSSNGKLDLDLALLRFINGGGSSVPTFFKVAFSTGLPTIAIVDNDKAGRRYKQKILKFLEEEGYEPKYEPVHFLRVDGDDVDLESILPASRLLKEINAACKGELENPIEETHLSADQRKKRSKNIEDYLSQQGFNYEEIKTDVSIAVAEEMGVEEIPDSLRTFFAEVVKMLQRRDQPLVGKKVRG